MSRIIHHLWWWWQHRHQGSYGIWKKIRLLSILQIKGPKITNKVLRKAYVLMCSAQRFPSQQKFPAMSYLNCSWSGRSRINTAKLIHGHICGCLGTFRVTQACWFCKLLSSRLPATTASCQSWSFNIPPICPQQALLQHSSYDYVPDINAFRVKRVPEIRRIK